MQSKEKIYDDLYISLLVIIIVLFCSCGRGSKQRAVTVPVDKEIVADGVGDHNGSASEDELKFIEEYFNSNPVAWCLGIFPSAYAGTIQIPAEIVLSAFMESALSGPYKSETDLRKAYEGINIKTLHVGVYVLISNEKCEIIQFWQAPGPRFSEREWVRMEIVSSE